MNDVPAAPRLSRKAVVSVALGLLAPLCLVTAGLPALLLGFYALRDINRSDGRLRGHGVAVAGMVLGAAGGLAFGAFLLAAVLTRLWEANNRAACQNNLRVLGQALNVYYDKQDPKRYPVGTVPHPDLPPDRRLSWMVDVLPYLPPEPAGRAHKSQDIYKAIDLARSWDAPANEGAVNQPVRWFLCRSDPGATADRRPGVTSYVGLAGVGADAPELPADSPRAGVFGYARRVTRDDVAAGLSHVMAVAETALDNGPWAAGGFPTLRPVVPEQRPYVGPDRPFGGCHPGGLNVLFLDGHVAFLRQDIPAATFEALATLAGD